MLAQLSLAAISVLCKVGPWIRKGGGKWVAKAQCYTKNEAAITHPPGQVQKMGWYRKTTRTRKWLAQILG